jgi:hypothetical protein
MVGQRCHSVAIVSGAEFVKRSDDVCEAGAREQAEAAPWSVGHDRMGKGESE